jgi:putative transposase
LQVFKSFSYLKEKPYWDNHFWAKGYFVDTVDVDAEVIHRYVKHQEKLERDLEQLNKDEKTWQ